MLYPYCLLFDKLDYYAVIFNIEKKILFVSQTLNYGKDHVVNEILFALELIIIKLLQDIPSEYKFIIQANIVIMRAIYL